MRMAFLLERRYAPYSKWLGSLFLRLPLSETLTPHLQAALLAVHWTERGEALAAAYLELAKHQNALGTAIFEPIVGPYFERPFATINADDAVASARAAIADPQLRELPVMGSLDQVSDLTPLLEDPVRSQRALHAILD